MAFEVTSESNERKRPWQTECFRQTEQNGNFGGFCFQSNIAFKVMNQLLGSDIKETSSDKKSKHKISSLFPVQGGKSISESSLRSFSKGGELPVVQEAALQSNAPLRSG